MNKSQLTTAIRDVMVKQGYEDVSRAAVVDFLDSFIEVVTISVKKGEPVTITNFCKFARKDVAAKPKHQGRNPFTGEEMTFKAKPASKSVRVSALKGFKDSVGGVKT
jgi:nucleoid DNA-binding protein